MPEISDADLAIYQRSLALLNKLHEKPDSRRALQNLVKQHVNKDVQTDDDFAAPFVAKIENELKPIKEFMTGVQTNAAEWQKQQQLSTLKSRGFTADGIEKIEKLAGEKKIDLIDAADLYEHRLPPKPIESKSISPQSWGFDRAENDEDKSWLSDPEGTSDKIAAQMLTEFRNQRNQE